MSALVLCQLWDDPWRQHKQLCCLDEWRAALRPCHNSTCAPIGILCLFPLAPLSTYLGRCPRAEITRFAHLPEAVKRLVICSSLASPLLCLQMNCVFVVPPLALMAAVRRFSDLPDRHRTLSVSFDQGLKPLLVAFHLFSHFCRNFDTCPILASL